MNSANYAPKQTEYCGVRFRSKSEAVFARCLDMAGHRWQYEPGVAAGHSWDFLIDRGRSQDAYDKLYEERFVFIEYKPSEPTEPYVQSLIEGMRHCPVESYLVYGNPWNPVAFPAKYDAYVTYPLFSHDCFYGWGDFDRQLDNGEDFLFSHRHHDRLGINTHANEASRYRFDLRACMPAPAIDFDFDPVIRINYTNKSETGRHERLSKIAASAVAKIGLYKIHELYDHKGELTVVWRNTPLRSYTWTIGHLWQTIGMESKESVVHTYRCGARVNL